MQSGITESVESIPQPEEAAKTPISGVSLKDHLLKVVPRKFSAQDIKSAPLVDLLDEREKTVPEDDSVSSEEANIESDSEEAKRYLPPEGNKRATVDFKELQRRKQALIQKAFCVKLHKENLRKTKARSGSPVSRKEYLEKLELEECRFKPKLDTNTVALAEEVKEKRTIKRIDELLYEDAKKRKERKKLLEQNSMFDIKKESSKSNVTFNSYKKVRDRLLKDLRTAMDFVNKSSKSHYLTFDSLGAFMHCIGIYKILFNSSYSVKLGINGQLESTDSRYKSEKFITRLSKEVEFHTNFWSILNCMKFPMVDSELVIELIMILFDLGSNDLEELVANIEQLLDIAHKEYRLLEDFKSMEPSPTSTQKIKELVKAFKKLNETKYTAETCNFLKTHGIVKPKEETYSFKPAINEVSRLLAEKHTDRYMTQVISKAEFESGTEPIMMQSARPASGAFDSRSQFTARSDLNTRIMIMYEKEKEKDRKLKMERSRKKIEELKECTFKPSLAAQYDLGYERRGMEITVFSYKR